MKSFVGKQSYNSVTSVNKMTFTQIGKYYVHFDVVVVFRFNLTIKVNILTCMGSRTKYTVCRWKNTIEFTSIWDRLRQFLSISLLFLVQIRQTKMGEARWYVHELSLLRIFFTSFLIATSKNLAVKCRKDNSVHFCEACKYDRPV